MFYCVLKPQTPIGIDNKNVELYVNRDGRKSIVMLLNHSKQDQYVTVKSLKAITLTNFETKDRISQGKEIAMKLKRAEVAITNNQ